MNGAGLFPPLPGSSGGAAELVSSLCQPSVGSFSPAPLLFIRRNRGRARVAAGPALDGGEEETSAEIEGDKLRALIKRVARRRGIS